ncbi:MAG: PEGA domain-containing protein [Candidatus Eisenbacteria bacterium]|nr:PEGA domain-containing protein [Candidatus Eisenbacteria bacterium]
MIRAWVLGLAVGLAAAGPVFAERSARETLGAAIGAYESADFGRAIDLFKEAAAEGSDLEPSDRALAFMYLASIYSARGITREAGSYFESCVEADPNFVPDEEIFRPDWILAFEEARDRKTGILDVTTEPPGAAVVFRGKKIGVTPFRARALEGSGTLRLELAGYRAAEKSVTVTRGETPARVGSIRLERAEGLLNVKTVPPEASVRIGTETFSSPVSRTVPEGKYVVRALLDGYEADAETVFVADRGRADLTIEMRETPEHAAARIERELRERAESIRSSKSRGKKVWTTLGVLGAAGGIAAGVVMQSQADESYDAYLKAVSPDDIDAEYSDYESKQKLSQAGYAAGGVFAAFTLYQILRGVPSVDEILSDLKREQGLSSVFERDADGTLRVGMRFPFGGERHARAE